MRRAVIVDESFCFQVETHLTVHKTSLFFTGDGFTVYNPQGDLILRVDSYGPDSHSRDELFLMDSSGKCLLTLRRKKPSLHQRWEGFLGERREGQEPIFSVYRASIIRGSGVVLEVYNDTGEEYQIEGSFGQRSCTIYSTTTCCSDNANSSSKEVVAEIKRKVDPTTNVLLGKDVFLLCLTPMIDSAFVMGLVLVLDQMVGDDAHQMDSTVQDDHASSSL